MISFISVIRRGGESVLVNAKALLPLPACDLTSDSVLRRENSSSGNICKVGFFYTAQERKL